MKLLFILPEYYPHSGGGISTYYLHYLKALKSEVKEICVLVGSGYTQSDEIFDIDGIKVEYLKPAIYKSYLPRFSQFDLTPEYRNNIAAAWAMWEQSNKGSGYDIIECADFGLGFVPWLVDQQKPVVVRFHGSNGQIDLFETKFKKGLSANLHRQTELILLPYATNLISHSTANQIYWENLFQNKQVELIYSIYNNIQNTVPFNKRDDHGIVCGRVQDWKGPDVLCQAMELLKDDKTLVKWYGRDTSFDGMINKITQLKKDYPKIWDVRILHKKPLPNPEINQKQKNAKFAIIPSTWDMFNFTGLEYLSAGTPLICSESAGVAELIENGVNGFTYANNDPSQLANCIESLNALDEKAYNTMVEKGRLTISKMLDAKKIVEANMLIYNNSIKKEFKLKQNPFIDVLYKPSNENFGLKDLLKNIRLKSIIQYVIMRAVKTK